MKKIKLTEKFKFNEVQKRLVVVEDNWFMPLKEDILFFMLAINNMSIATYLYDLLSSESSSIERRTVVIMAKILPIGTWASMFIFVGTGLFLCAVVIKNRKTKAQVLLWSCLLGFLIWTLYSMLGVKIGQAGATTTRNMCIAIVHMVLFFIQVVELWRIRLQTKL